MRGTQPNARRPVRLVIADDSADMRSFVREAVGGEFREVIEVSDGRQLFWTLLRADFLGGSERDLLIVTDLYMPAYDGLAVIDAWREVYPKAPAVLITAFPSDEVRRRASDLGAVMLAKPFSTADLKRVVHDIMEGNHGNEQ
jgi:CheY-like chemotaxis protein